jgi:predicted kinase
LAKLVLTRGLPASGKSTYAKGWVEADPQNRIRVNRDDIRFMLYGKYWGVDEQQVSEVERAAVKAGLESGRDVIVDATHLRARAITEWRKLGYETEIVDFVAPVQELFYRDQNRILDGGRGVGGTVIPDMAKRYHIPADGTLPPLPDPPEVFSFIHINEWPIERTRGRRPAIIVDVDGTIANHQPHRGPYDTTKYHLDTTHEDVINTVDFLQQAGMQLLITSGRSEEFRGVTEEWIKRVALLQPDAIFMRGTDDRRNDAIVKHDLYYEHIHGNYEVLMVFDDRNRVVDMWRAIGLTCAQVAPGEF